MAVAGPPFNSRISSSYSSNNEQQGAEDEAPPTFSEQLTEKACKMCRARKVKCDRKWPTCAKCADRGDTCDFGNMVPAGMIPDVGVGDTQKLQILESRLAEMEQTLEDIRMRDSNLPELLADGIRAAYMEGARDPAEIFQAFGIARFQGESSIDWRLARKALSASLCLHLVDSFFTSCCAYLPVFEPWHKRLLYVRDNIDKLSPATRVAVAGFCAMGARASPHSALLGLYVGDIDIWPTPPAVVEAGSRRELACQAIHNHAMDLCHRLEIAHDASVVNLETLLVEIQMLIFKEIMPRKSRSLMRLALGQFKDLIESSLSEQEKVDLAERLGLPLVLGDALTSAYARKPPLITIKDLQQYFYRANFEVLYRSQDSGGPTLAAILDHHIPRTAADGYVTHVSLVGATTTLACWLAACQRDFAHLATYQVTPKPIDATEIHRLWAALDEIHDAVQRIQQILVHVSYLPTGCESDGCADLHLRFDTRLDRDVSDVVHLIHTFILDRAGLTATLPHDSNLLPLFNESEGRVRRSLKLVAFYSQLYITSHDQHMCHHLTFQLELLPDWTTLVVQRHGENPGPATPDLEVTELELDWFVKGLRVAAFYHPRARRRLYEIEQGRRPPRESQNRTNNEDQEFGRV